MLKSLPTKITKLILATGYIVDFPFLKMSLENQSGQFCVAVF